MTSETESGRDGRREPGRPLVPFEAGYQPKARGPVDPAQLKPPRDGSAIQRPQAPSRPHDR
jgi:hypothetical protein